LAECFEQILSGSDLEAAVFGGRVAQASFKGAKVALSSWVQAEFERPQDIQAAVGWQNAFYSDKDLAALGLPLDHNENLRQRLGASFPVLRIDVRERAIVPALKVLENTTQAVQAARDRIVETLRTGRAPEKR